VAPHRLLLDQNFPSPVFGLEELDETVQFVPLYRFASELAKESTPDWVIYLAAAAAKFDGIVTRDRSQIDEPEALVALALTQLCVVTWATPIEDPVTEWAQLMAYIPEIKKRLDEGLRRVILLPAPRLRPEQFRMASALLQERAALAKTSANELRSDALSRMRQELTRRRRTDLVDILDSGGP
jgi:hypothetical protein